MATSIDKNFVVTTPEIQGYRIVKYLGLAHGISKEYYKNNQDMIAVNDATEDMMFKAKELGANAIVGSHYQLFPLNEAYNTLRFFCAGTAVIIEPVASSVQV